MILNIPKPVILASVSPRRALLLQQIGIRASVIPSSVEEELSCGVQPREFVVRNALNKALDVSPRIENGIVIGADTIVVLNGKILGKPRDEEEAKHMLRMLSGREHRVYTGFALVDRPSNAQITDVEETRVVFRSIPELEIEAYVRSGSPMDKAGAYGIQDDYGAVFVERIEGDFYTVVGFPLAKFYIRLQELLRHVDGKLEHR
ncbi:MAG: Maf family protein [Bacteroidota bacterium]